MKYTKELLRMQMLAGIITEDQLKDGLDEGMSRKALMDQIKLIKDMPLEDATKKLNDLKKEGLTYTKTPPNVFDYKVKKHGLEGIITIKNKKI